MKYRKYGFKTSSEFLAHIRVLDILRGPEFATRVYDLVMVPKIPYIRTTPKDTDHKRVAWARDIGMTKSQARKYMRHGVIPQ